MKFKHALLEWRNTPRHNDKFSLAQYFLGRRQRTEVVALPELFKRVLNENLEEAEALRAGGGTERSYQITSRIMCEIGAQCWQ